MHTDEGAATDVEAEDDVGSLPVELDVETAATSMPSASRRAGLGFQLVVQVQVQIFILSVAFWEGMTNNAMVKTITCCELKHLQVPPCKGILCTRIQLMEQV